MRRLELGSGFDPTPGFEHLDVNPNAPHVEHVCSAFDPLPFEDGTFDELRAVDVLEHTSYRDTDWVLWEWARVCAPGGRLYVQVPDATEIMRWYMNAPERLTVPPDLPQTALVGAAWRLLGGHADGRYVEDGADWKWNAHFALFDCLSLTTHLDRAGFVVESMKTNGHPNLLCWARKR